MSERRLNNRDAERFAQDGVARRGFSRQSGRERAAAVRECGRLWIGKAPTHTRTGIRLPAPAKKGR